jgi:hypothetical protein
MGKGPAWGGSSGGSYPCPSVDIRVHPCSCPVYGKQPPLVSQPAQSHPSFAPARIGAGSVRRCQFRAAGRPLDVNFPRNG